MNQAINEGHPAHLGIVAKSAGFVAPPALGEVHERSRLGLLFVSTRYLFPADSGGKIRTTQILRGLKNGAFEVTLASPAPSDARSRHSAELESVCDRFAAWPDQAEGFMARARRVAALGSPLPVAVATDRSAAGRRVVESCLAERPDVVVFDFPHSVVLAPSKIDVPSVMFTHNVESWIYERHAKVAGNFATRAVWRGQHRKMLRFEDETLARFDSVVAVSEKDQAWFRDRLGLAAVQSIPTGVDLGYFEWREPVPSRQVVFIGSMDWIANQDAMRFLLEDVWPLVESELPDATMKVIGRSPPAWLVAKAPAHSWSFTGFVDDVRPHARSAALSVIPLRVGGGTRIKAYEAMAMGLPVVSTSIGVEGLPLTPEEHYLCADDAPAFAAAVVRLLRHAELRTDISRRARAFVETSFSHCTVARAFEEICLAVARDGRS